MNIHRYPHAYKSNKTKDDSELTASAHLLIWLFAGFEFIPRPFEGKTAYFKRQLSGKIEYKTYLNALHWLERKGLLKIYKEKKHQFIALTKQGVLETLFSRARMPAPQDWDGRIRLIIFDIPEDAKEYRHYLRSLLKANGFRLIQKSVYVSPYPLNTAAITYLKESGLDEYIRIFRVDRADKMDEFIKMFNLK